MLPIIFLTIHISAGTLALISGGLAALSPKGQKRHRKSGRFFAYSMWTTALSALALSIIRPNPFLLTIGLFTLYMTTSGWIWIMRLPQERKLKMIRPVSIVGIAFGMFMLGYGVWGTEGIHILLLVFGTGQLILPLPDLKKGSQAGKNPILHGGKMGGAYIAAVTAFLVVNVDFLPALVVWLAPSVVGTVLITTALARWKKRMRG